MFEVGMREVKTLSFGGKLSMNSNINFDMLTIHEIKPKLKCLPFLLMLFL